MGFIIEGGAADLTSSIPSLVKTLLTDQWTESTVGESNIVFGNDWYNGFGDYQIHVRFGPATNPSPSVLGSTRYEYQDFVDIHVFVRALSEDLSANVDVLKKEIERIMGENPTGLSASNIREIGMPRWTYLTERDSQTTLWHLVGRCELHYQKVKT